MELKLPRSLGTRDLYGLFAVAGKLSRCEDETVVLDASELEFIEPHGLTVLGATLASMEGKHQVHLHWLTRQLAGYMDRMNFFQHCSVEGPDVPDRQRNPLPEKLVELTRIGSSTEAGALADRLADAISGHLTKADPDAPIDPATGRNEYQRYRHPLWYALSELLNNAVTHGKRFGALRAEVWVAAQFYEKTNTVKLSVVDTGCGILRTLETHPRLAERTHLSAIRAALEPKVSCNRDSPYDHGHGNQGVGLTTTSRIAKAAKGRLHVVSGNALVETGEMRGGVLPNDGIWNGVAIAFSCQRHAIPAVNVPQLLPVEKNTQPIRINFVDE